MDDWLERMCHNCEDYSRLTNLCLNDWKEHDPCDICGRFVLRRDLKRKMARRMGSVSFLGEAKEIERMLDSEMDDTEDTG